MNTGGTKKHLHFGFSGLTIFSLTLKSKKDSLRTIQHWAMETIGSKGDCQACTQYISFASQVIFSTPACQLGGSLPYYLQWLCGHLHKSARLQQHLTRGCCNQSMIDAYSTSIRASVKKQKPAQGGEFENLGHHLRYGLTEERLIEHPKIRFRHISLVAIGPWMHNLWCFKKSEKSTISVTPG